MNKTTPPRLSSAMGLKKNPHPRRQVSQNPPTLAVAGEAAKKPPTLVGKSTKTPDLWAAVKARGVGSRSARARAKAKKKIKNDTQRQRTISPQLDGGLRQPSMRARQTHTTRTKKVSGFSKDRWRPPPAPHERSEKHTARSLCSAKEASASQTRGL